MVIFIADPDKSKVSYPKRKKTKQLSDIEVGLKRPATVSVAHNSRGHEN